MIDWQRHLVTVEETLANSAPGTSVATVVEAIKAKTGDPRFTYDALKDACRRHLGSSPRHLIGTRYRASIAVPEPALPAHPSPVPGLRDASGGPGSVQVDRPAMPRRLRRVIATGDWHSPYHDDEAMSVFFAAVDYIRPDVVVLLGDHVDCFTISRFDKTPDRVKSLEDEIAVTNELLDRIKAPVVHYCEGNHEHRLPRYLSQKAPELWGMMSMRKLLKIDERGWKWRNYRDDAVRIGRMAFKHDVGRCGKYASHHSLADYGGNICFGHTHHGGTVYQSTVKGSQRVALNTGWLGDVDAIDYRHREMARRDYQHGFGLVYVDDSTGNVYAQFKPIVGGSCEVDGTLITATGPVRDTIPTELAA